MKNLDCVRLHDSSPNLVMWEIPTFIYPVVILFKMEDPITDINQQLVFPASSMEE